MSESATRDTSGRQLPSSMHRSQVTAAFGHRHTVGPADALGANWADESPHLRGETSSDTAHDIIDRTAVQPRHADNQADDFPSSTHVQPVHGLFNAAGLIVGIPARNEEARIVNAITSVLAATDRIDPDQTVVVVVACDACDDATIDLAHRIARRDPRLVVIEGDWRSAGSARRAAIRRGLDDLAGRGVRADRCWIASTDADTSVPTGWLTEQLEYAQYYDAVAGIVELTADDDRTLEVAAVFTDTYPVGPIQHPHIHAANMGIRGGPYNSVGGFPDVHVGEDHGLWDALQSAGFRCCSPSALAVRTSARLHSRAPGGFADTIRARLEQRRRHTDEPRTFLTPS